MHFFAESNRIAKLDAGDAGPKWNQLFPLGVRYRSDFPEGKADFTPQFLNTMLSNWQASGKPALPVDYFHRGPTYEEGANEDKVASGWIEDLELRDDGLYALIKWTDDARALILADKLRYLSPMFAFNAKSRLTGKLQGPTLGGAGLLNDPFLQDLPAVAASDTIKESRGGTDSLRVHEVSVDKKKICAALGIDDSSTDDAVMGALMSRLAKTPPPPAGTPADDKKMAAYEVSLAAAQEATKFSDAKLATVTAEAGKLAERVKSLEKDKGDAAVAALTEKLMAEGRMKADDKERVGKLVAALGIEEATKLAMSWPKQVPLTEVGKNGAPVEQLLADTPEAAYVKFSELAKALSKEKKISLTAAKAELYDEPTLQALVALASRNTGEKRN